MRPNRPVKQPSGSERLLARNRESASWPPGQVGVAPLISDAMVIPMSRLAKVVAVVVVTLWVPATQHCRLEALLDLDALACDSHEHSTSHEDRGCADDGCALVESGQYFASTGRSLPVESRAATWSPEATPTYTSAGPPCYVGTQPSEIPILLSARWRFILRTAPLARAPSLIS
jgi:hypothetical protein